MQLDNRDRDQLLNILIQTRRLTKIAFSTNSISPSEQDLILREVEHATAILRKKQTLTEEVKKILPLKKFLPLAAYRENSNHSL